MRKMKETRRDKKELIADRKMRSEREIEEEEQEK